MYLFTDLNFMVNLYIFIHGKITVISNKPNLIFSLELAMETYIVKAKGLGLIFVYVYLFTSETIFCASSNNEDLRMYAFLYKHSFFFCTILAEIFPLSVVMID